MRDQSRTARVTVGRNVRQLRLQRGLSQERLAELAGKASKFIGQIERGQVNIGLDSLVAIANALSVSVPALFLDARGGGPGTRVVALTERELESIDRALQIVRNARRAVRAPRRK